MKPTSEKGRIMNVAIRWRISYEEAIELIDIFENAQTKVEERKSLSEKRMLITPFSTQFYKYLITIYFPYLMLIYS